jgi:hypothetical protein
VPEPAHVPEPALVPAPVSSSVAGRTRSRSQSRNLSNVPIGPSVPNSSSVHNSSSDNEPTKVVYTGRYNYFSNTKASVWATKRSDTCYYTDDEWSDEMTFVEYL